MKKNILIVSGSLHKVPPEAEGTAVAALLFHLAENLNEYDVKVLSFDKSKINQSAPSKKYFYVRKESFKYKLLYRIAKVFPHRVNKKIWGKDNPKFIAYYWCYASLLRKIEPDLIMTTMHIDAFRAAYRFYPKAKHVFYYRSSRIQDEGYDKLQFLSSMASKVITLTNESRVYLEENFPSESTKFVTIQNAINRHIFNDIAVRGQRYSARKRWKLNPTDFVIGYAGRLSKSKGIDVIISALRELLEKGQNVKLLIAGDHKMETIPEHNFQLELRRQLKYIPGDRIVYTGWLNRKEMLDFYSAIDVAVLLSQFKEGNSMFLLESQSCGIPAIASSVGGNSEIIINNKTGFLLAKNDKTGIVKIIEELLEDRDKVVQFGKQAAENVACNYNYDILINKLNMVFKDIME